jgi:hypothetical protein
MSYTLHFYRYGTPDSIRTRHPKRVAKLFEGRLGLASPEHPIGWGLRIQPDSLMPRGLAIIYGVDGKVYKQDGKACLIDMRTDEEREEDIAMFGPNYADIVLMSIRMAEEQTMNTFRVPPVTWGTPSYQKFPILGPVAF